MPLYACDDFHAKSQRTRAATTVRPHRAIMLQSLGLGAVSARRRGTLAMFAHDGTMKAPPTVHPKPPIDFLYNVLDYVLSVRTRVCV